MKKKFLVMVRMVIFLILFISLNACSEESVVGSDEMPFDGFNGELKVLSLNTWHEGNQVSGGFDAIVDVIIQSDADFILLSEIRNSNGIIFSDRILRRLESEGSQYYSYNSKRSTTILSRFPIQSVSSTNSSYLSKCKVQIDENTVIALYAAHLDYTHYACYLPRGYSGITWDKLPEPILDIDKILDQNLASQRDEAIEVFIKNALLEKDNGNIVILGGDFNEPSHLDWTAATKNLFDHKGLIIPWHNSQTLYKNGFLDSYRTKYPNPVSYPGITWPAYNRHVSLSSLVWTPEADDRERIDFVYYYPDVRIELVDAVIMGPVGSISYGNIEHVNPGNDRIIEPEGKWPSDHKGVLTTFSIN